MDRALPMNSGAEAVETAIKTARVPGVSKQRCDHDDAIILVARNNFHGRTTTIISFSDDPVAHDDFGPYTPGFREVDFGDLDALTKALEDPNVVAFPGGTIQGEAGVVVPPDGYLPGVAAACKAANVLFIADEIQAGLGRTGYAGSRP